MKFHAHDLQAPVPEGTYLVKIADIQERTSRNGNQLVEIRHELQEGEYAGQILRDYFVTDASNDAAARVGRRRLLRLCRLCQLEVRPGQEVSLSDLVGRLLVASVVEDVHAGLPVSRVQDYAARSDSHLIPF